MYSVLMVMAMNVGAAATPAWDHGCGGCYSGCYSGCYAASCSGCWGGCNGCGGGHRLFGGLFHKNRCSGCNGCWSGCSSSHRVSYGCTGCNGCYASCNGCNGGHRLFGGLFRKNRCHGCNGCYASCSGCNGHVMCSGCTGCHGTMAAPAQQPAPAPAPAPKKEGGSSTSLNQAELLVSVPAEAKLFIDGQATVSTTNSRKFVSPELEQGKEYFYTLRAEVVRDGKTVSLTKEVTVRAGETVQASFEFPLEQVAAN